MAGGSVQTLLPEIFSLGIDMNENIVAGVVKQFNELAELTEIFVRQNQVGVSVHKSVSEKGLINSD